MTNFIANGTDTFAVTSATYGDVSGTITFKTDNTGTFSGTATNEPTGSVKNGAFSGTFSISGGKVTVTISDTTFTFMGTPVTCSNNLTTKLN
ncbi:MAG: hypothetical protein HYV03_02500 [Deltaproteobacteria bacterium]|nr:hypothetical protein [Deltaproteobacteria bacterium]